MSVTALVNTGSFRYLPKYKLKILYMLTWWSLWITFAVNGITLAAMCSVEENRECWPGTCQSNGLASSCQCNIGFLTKKNSDGTIAHCQCKLYINSKIRIENNYTNSGIIKISQSRMNIQEFLQYFRSTCLYVYTCIYESDIPLYNRSWWSVQNFTLTCEFPYDTHWMNLNYGLELKQIKVNNVNQLTEKAYM